MPRVKQKASRSLKELCLQSISSNIDSFWCREFLENYHGKAHYLFVLGKIGHNNLTTRSSKNEGFLFKAQNKG